MMAAFNGEMFVVKPRWSGDCFSVNIVRKLVLAMCSSSLHICQQNYITIKSIYNKIIPKVVTMDELKEAIKAINTGKSEDIWQYNYSPIIL
jgi:hypothetical protein